MPPKAMKSKAKRVESSAPVKKQSKKQEKSATTAGKKRSKVVPATPLPDRIQAELDRLNLEECDVDPVDLPDRVFNADQPSFSIVTGVALTKEAVHRFAAALGHDASEDTYPQEWWRGNNKISAAAANLGLDLVPMNHQLIGNVSAIDEAVVCIVGQRIVYLNGPEDTCLDSYPEAKLKVNEEEIAGTVQVLLGSDKKPKVVTVLVNNNCGCCI